MLFMVKNELCVEVLHKNKYYKAFLFNKFLVVCYDEI